MAVWFKLDVHLPTNPKIKRASRLAGHWAPMAYVSLLAINKMHSFKGEIPADYGAPEELADWWRMSEGAELMRSGLRACRAENLVEFTSDSILLVGWGPEWDRSDSSAERQKRYREKKKKGQVPVPTEGDVTLHNGVTHNGATVTDNVTEGVHRGEEKRGEENRGEERTPMVPLREPTPESVENVAKPPTPPKLKKPKRQTEAERLVSEWGEQAGELWDLQEMLRASVMPRSRPLKPDQERISRVCQRLDGGASVEDCEAVLRSYASETKRNGEAGKHFNGETNWRKSNFDRALGGVGAEPPTTTTGRAKPMSRESVQKTGEQDLRE